MHLEKRSKQLAITNYDKLTYLTTLLVAFYMHIGDSRVTQSP
jgi:hypothetical protein